MEKKNIICELKNFRIGSVTSACKLSLSAPSNAKSQNRSERFARNHDECAIARRKKRAALLAFSVIVDILDLMASINYHQKRHETSTWKKKRQQENNSLGCCTIEKCNVQRRVLPLQLIFTKLMKIDVEKLAFKLKMRAANVHTFKWKTNLMK